MNIEDIYNKLSKEELSADDLAQLEKWKQEAEANAKSLLMIQQIKNADLSDYYSYDADQAWQKFKDKTETSSAHSSTVKWLVFLLILLSGVLGYMVYDYYNKTEPATVYPIHYANEVNKQNINLTDGTEVILDQSSELVQNGDRSVSVTGRAFFNVKSDVAHPFTVNTPVGDIQVLGTRFSVEADSASIDIYVDEGVVQFIDKSRKIELRAQDKMVLLDGNISKVKLYDENYLSWTDGKLIFRDAPLVQVIEAIERHYGNDLSIDQPALLQGCKITTAFENESYKAVLEELKVLVGLKYNRDGSGIIIVDSDC